MGLDMWRELQFQYSVYWLFKVQMARYTRWRRPRGPGRRRPRGPGRRRPQGSGRWRRTTTLSPDGEDLEVPGGGGGLRLDRGEGEELDGKGRDDEVPGHGGVAVAVGGQAEGEIDGAGVASKGGEKRPTLQEGVEKMLTVEMSQAAAQLCWLPEPVVVVRASKERGWRVLRGEGVCDLGLCSKREDEGRV
ncbi:hypothetical protein Acr_17g0001830 [Actinidia rufa]|uniref:Uncharacterized protein n=1 Tax=Actinidia rufa TaxID=165716 RepID=A0A7J0G1F4_9ERIC|nr:hypothetical protein Acr_17g0001830 [Actinidia rufa]